MKIGDGKIVRVAYTLTGDDGALLEKADASDPFEYLHGPKSGILSGLQDALEGHSAGDHLSVSLTPEQGYGLRDDSKVRKVPLRRFGAQKVKVGERLGMDVGGGRIGDALVMGINGDYASVDQNHPLAGKSLKFELDVLLVRDATPEELRHGHAHGPGDHHH